MNDNPAAASIVTSLVNDDRRMKSDRNLVDSEIFPSQLKPHNKSPDNALEV